MVSFSDFARGDASLGPVDLSAGVRSLNLDHSYSFPNPDYYGFMQIVTGDFNRDGIPDLALTYDQLAVTILMGNGHGTFRGGTSPQISQGNNAITVGDFNGDGIPDLAVGQVNSSAGSPCCTVSIMPGLGNGSFPPPREKFLL